MIPITQGGLQTTVAAMNIGDYIAARYITTAMTAHGTFSEIGTVDTGTVPVFTSSALNGYVYLMKISKGVLVSLTQLYSGVTYATMNAVNRIYGSKVTIGGRDYLVRVPNINEYITMAGTLGGKLDVADRYTNFNTTSALYEVVQENYNLTEGGWLFTVTPATAANSSAYATARYARLVLEYAEDSKCVDLYH